MALRPLPLPPDPTPLPARVAAVLADGRALLAAHFARPDLPPGHGAIPSDHERVVRGLRSLRANDPGLRRFLEWGSGLGIVAIAAALLGYDAHGIEWDDAMVAEAQRFASAHGVDVPFVAGSFVPPGSDALLDRAELTTRTVLQSDDAYDRLERDLDDFDVVFAYPWPEEEALYRRLFQRGAADGAVLVLYGQLDGVRAFRKVAGRGG
jgi:predicted O-methyltransferase YrrM